MVPKSGHVEESCEDQVTGCTNVFMKYVLAVRSFLARILLAIL